MLSFEGTPFVGVSDIMGNLTTLPFENASHTIATLDAQPSVFRLIYS